MIILPEVQNYDITFSFLTNLTKLSVNMPKTRF